MSETDEKPSCPGAARGAARLERVIQPVEELVIATHELPAPSSGPPS